MTTFGTRMKELRTSRSLRQDQLAEILEIAPSTVGAYERDTREPNFELVVKMADYFNVSLDYMFCRTDDKRTVAEALKDNSYDLKEFLRNNYVLFNGNELSVEDKQRILDVLLGLFWNDIRGL